MELSSHKGNNAISSEMAEDADLATGTASGEARRKKMTHCHQRAADGTMLKYLTHKLRSHSINEDHHNQEKVDDDHDSGTESDDEFQNAADVPEDELSTVMDSFEEPVARDSAVPSDVDLGASPPNSTISYTFQAISPTFTEIKSDKSYDFLLALSQNDQHSSEEELEVINGPNDNVATQVRSSSRPSALPEKRKWSEANRGSCEEDTNKQQPSSSQSNDNTAATVYSAPVSRTGRGERSGSSDDELQGLCCSRSGSAISQPVQFRSSPPSDAHKPGRSLSPPSKLFHASIAEIKPTHRPRSRPRPHSHYHSQNSLDQHQDLTASDLDVIGACSPRKRHRPPLPRPCLDFEKMQQMKTQAVTSWRHTSEHGKELSVFCW